MILDLAVLVAVYGILFGIVWALLYAHGERNQND